MVQRITWLLRRMRQVGEHSGLLPAQKLLPGIVGVAPVAATQIKTDALNLKSAQFVALTTKTNNLLLVVKFRVSVTCYESYLANIYFLKLENTNTL